MPHKPGRKSSRPSSTSPQILSGRLPVVLRALASRKRLPCCVRRSRTEVTATINQTSSANGSSGMGMLPFMDVSAYKVALDFVESRPNEIARQRKLFFNAAPQVFQLRHQGLDRFGFVGNTALHDP